MWDELVWQAAPAAAVQIFQKHQDELLEKGAASPTLQQLARLWQLQPGKILGTVPSAPGPLMSMLVGGLAGAGIGNVGGRLAGSVLPDNWDKRKLRRNLTMLGAGLGATPGLGLAGVNTLTGRHWNSSELLGEGYQPPPYDFSVDTAPEVKAAVEKVSLLAGAGVSGMPMVDVNEFNQVIWRDPRVARPLSPAVRAAASGLVTSAANLPGKTSTRFVSPMDVGRIAAGMGSGYVSGALVGKALGLLTGMPQETQDRLKNTGVWAGIVGNIVPIAFGG